MTTVAPIQQANGFLVALQTGDYFQHFYTEEWSEALDYYREPPSGWRSVGVSACRGGVPFALLDMQAIAAISKPTHHQR